VVQQSQDQRRAAGTTCYGSRRAKTSFATCPGSGRTSGVLLRLVQQLPRIEPDWPPVIAREQTDLDRLNALGALVAGLWQHQSHSYYLPSDIATNLKAIF
jgi:hypothetical protein